jgi:dimethylamine/trimethylamine dehydrogenase
MRLDPDGVREYGAEIVVVATGAHWTRDGLNRDTHEPIPGADASLPNVLTPEQIMVEGKTPPGKRVVVYDSDGYFMGPDLAERLAVEGLDVDFVTSLEDVSPFSHETLEQVFLKERLHEVGVRMHRSVRLERIERGRGACADEFGRLVELEADAVVLVTQRLSDDALYHELRADEERLDAEGIEAVYRIGDCVAPQLIADAIFDGHRLAREIDSENPAVPLPYVRERPVSALA